MTSRRALWTLIAVSGLLRLAWSASLGLGNDEAYHYLFTVHPDWSYFDHPPMTALVERAGLTLRASHGYGQVREAAETYAEAIEYAKNHSSSGE